MTVSRATIAARAEERRAKTSRASGASRGRELLLLLAASLTVASGLWLAYAARVAELPDESKLLNLNQVSGAYQLLPLLRFAPNETETNFIANQVYEQRRHGAHFDNVGALARIRVHADQILGTRGLDSFRTRLAESNHDSIPLLTPAQIAALKPFLIVRTAVAFRHSFFMWTALFFAAFYAVHVLWRVRRFTGDSAILPAMHVLAGVGFILMITLRDPLRDTLLFADFAQGVVVGCAALFLFSLPDYERSSSRLSYIPLLIAVALALALGIFGTGPGTSEAKVNLFFFQPVEIIRILVVFFLAGYFAQNWEMLRHLRQRNLSSRFAVPRLDYVLPVAAGVAVSLALFFWLSDLGPALVLGCLFLAMYAVARKRALLAFTGLVVIIAGFAVGHLIGHPHTVTQRVNMWRSPWNNSARGGDQLADSLWALATGGVTGTGLGLGDPETVPAAHTDLILSALGEQLGLLGLIVVFVLYSLLVYRSLRIALRAPGPYSFFLVIGLLLVTALQILLISGGLLGLIPLSGVVSPFLSYGRTSMVANFALFAIILSVSARAAKSPEAQEAFGAPARVLAGLLATAVVVVIARAAYIQAFRADNILVQGTLVMQADGVRRYQYNPRLLAIAREIPKGAILDRNGLPLAATDAAVLARHHDEYQALGINFVPSDQGRQYPLGPRLFYLLGDVRSRLKQGASNTAFQERSSRVRLQGFDDVADVEELRDIKTGQIATRVRRDYRELIPLLRHRYEPENPQVKELLARPRDVKMTIDAGLQMRVSNILEQHLNKLGKQKGAAVVLDPATGDLLAAVSYPWPSPAEFASLSTNAQTPVQNVDLIDRARFGLYPPGSSFKIVTAMAALRKDPALAQQRFDCIRLPDNRVGNFVWKREIRDDIKDTAPHGSVDMAKGIAVSCNAYFAQLGANKVGAKDLYETAFLLGISVASPNTPQKLQEYLPQAAYGQGQVVASSFQMARVAATVANGGNAPQGRWILDETNARVRQPQAVLPPNLADQLGRYMRQVVTSGTGRVLNSLPISIAGKTGTAELGNAPSHAWFIGFAPYGAPAAKQIAFAVLVENGQYGGTAAAPIAGEIVMAAKQLGIIREVAKKGNEIARRTR